MAITNKDIDRLKDAFASKEELNAKFDGLSVKFDRLLSGQDKIMGELEKAREDRVFAQGKDREQDRRLDGLEQRVGKIEAKAG